MSGSSQLKSGALIFGGRFVLKVPSGGLEAFLIAKDELGIKHVDLEQIKKEICEQGVVYGLLPEPEPVAGQEETFRIARGMAPEDGLNAQMKMHVNPSSVRTPKVKNPEKDQVDFRELGSIVNVRSGTLLMEKIPPTPGTPGKDVLGNDIPPRPGKESRLKKGQGVRFDEDEKKVYSEIDGKFLLIDGKPAVLNEHTVGGDIDMSVGNILFVGKTLNVSGEVLPGFKLKCRGDINIGQGVNNADVAAGGNIKIKGNIVGEEAIVRARGDMDVVFVENGPRLAVMGDLRVTGYLVQCEARVGGNIYAEKKGTIIGGKSIVGGSIYVKELGSDAEVSSDISVGMDLTIRSQKEFMEKEVPLWSGRLNDLLKNISGLQKMKKEMGKEFPTEYSDKLQKYQKVMPKLMEKVEKLNARLNQLEEKIDTMVDEAIYVYGKVYPGVTVRIGTAVRTIAEEEEQVIIHFDRTSRQIHVRKMTSKERQARDK